jgi:hypothetical protein
MRPSKSAAGLMFLLLPDLLILIIQSHLSVVHAQVLTGFLTRRFDAQRELTAPGRLLPFL